eukprot:11610846-Alexandrium_andersonii.AAC.1
MGCTQRPATVLAEGGPGGALAAMSRAMARASMPLAGQPIRPQVQPLGIQSRPPPRGGGEDRAAGPRA